MASEASTRLTQSQLARLLKVSRQRVHALVAKGVLVVGEDGKIDGDEAIQTISAHANPAHAMTRETAASRLEATRAAAPASAPAGEPATAPTPAPEAQPSDADGLAITSYQVAKTLREKFAALNERLEYQTRRGELLRRDIVESAIFTLARNAQEALRAIPDRLSTQLAAESDPHRVHALLDAEIRQVVADLAAGPKLPERAEAA